MPFAVEEIDHVEVFVRDIEAAARWYSEVLGLREIARGDHVLHLGASARLLCSGQPNCLLREIPWRLTMPTSYASVLGYIARP